MKPNHVVNSHFTKGNQGIDLHNRLRQTHLLGMLWQEASIFPKGSVALGEIMRVFAGF